MDEIKHGQLVASAAQIYEAFYLPALFQSWVEPMRAAADIQPGQQVLDVACGTGVLARGLWPHLGDGTVIGLDINPEMLTVARQQAPKLDWRQGAAEQLPFADNQFDRVTCQFGLMFFANRSLALKEMCRVLRPGGKLTIAVWDTLANTPGYRVMVELLTELFGPDIAAGLEAPYCLGDKVELAELFNGLPLTGVCLDTVTRQAVFPTLADWIHTDIKGWTLADKIDDYGLARLQAAAPDWLSQFIAEDGTIRFAAPGHIVTGSITGR